MKKDNLVRAAGADMMPALRDLWERCFADGPFGDLAFAELIRAERVLAIADERDQPLAMLVWEPVRVLRRGEAVPGAYVYGVCTDPAQRGKGLSTRLMEGMDEYFEERGIALSLLVPSEESLFGFYGARGYETAFSYRKVMVEHWQLPPGEPGGVLSAVALEQLEERRTAQFADSVLFPAWERNWLRYAGLECRLLRGEVLRYAVDGERGYAVCYPVGDRLLVKELAVRPERLESLLAALHARYGKRRYELRLPVDFPVAYPGIVLPFGMVKWYDKRKGPQAGPDGGSAPWLAFVLD